MTAISPLDFTDAQAYLRALLSKNAKLSQRGWAKKLGYRSHRSLGMILQGKRPLNRVLIEKLARSQGFAEHEHSYLRLLAQKTAGVPAKQTEKILADLENIKAPLKRTHLLSETEFDEISDWYFFVIKQLVTSPSFKLGISSFKERLPENFPLSRVKPTLQTLLRLGLISYDVKTKRFKERKVRLRTTHDVPRKKIKENHLQWLKLLERSIVSDPPEERENLSLTFRYNRLHLKEVKEFLRYFREEFDQKFGYQENGEDVFQLMIHLMPVTRAVPGDSQ